MKQWNRELVLLLILVMVAATVVVSLFLTHFKLFGYIRTVFAHPGLVFTDTFDENNPNSNPEYYIASKENLVVSGGQVKLADVCSGVENNTQVEGCNGTCEACQSDTCGYATKDTDPGEKCSATDCCTGLCDDSGACDCYTSGQHGCEDCYACNKEGFCAYMEGADCGLEEMSRCVDHHCCWWDYIRVDNFRVMCGGGSSDCKWSTRGYVGYRSNGGYAWDKTPEHSWYLSNCPGSGKVVALKCKCEW